MGLAVSGSDAAAGVVAGIGLVNPAAGAVAGVALEALSALGVSFESKSVAGLDRTAGRLFRAGAPVLVASAMYRRGGTGDDVYKAAVEALGVKTAPESGQTKKGYSYDPPVRLRDDKTSATEAKALLVFLADARAGRDSSAADPTEAVASTYDWVALLRAMNVAVESSDAPVWLKRKAAPTAPSSENTGVIGGPGTYPKSDLQRSVEGAFGTGSGIPWWVWLLFPAAVAVFLVVWLIRRL